jgi:hypothetical protein
MRYTAPFGHEKLTVSTTAVGFTAAELKVVTSGLSTDIAVEALVSTEDAPIRFTLDGTTPVDATATGHVLANGDTMIIYGVEALTRFRAVRNGGTDAVVNVTYFRT